MKYPHRLFSILHSLFSICIFSILHSLFSIPLNAHEGHQPLPTKGVQVDTERGYITLSGQARNAIGLETTEVAIGDVSSQQTAYAEAVAPWNAKAFGSAQISGRITKLFVRLEMRSQRVKLLLNYPAVNLIHCNSSLAKRRKNLLSTSNFLNSRNHRLLREPYQCSDY